MRRFLFLHFAFGVLCVHAVMEPIWVKGAEREMNAFYGFAARFSAKKGDDVKLRMSAASIAKVWVNGEFAAYGPARAAEGYMRIDEWPIGGLLRDGENVIAIEVANSAVNEFYFMEQPAFLAAEIVADNRILASTASNFKAIKLPVVQRTSRFSYQRGFTEFYRVTPEDYRWRRHGIDGAGLETVSVQRRKSLPRAVSYPDMTIDRTFKPTVRSSLVFDEGRKIKTFATLEAAGKSNFKGFAKEDLEVNAFEKMQRIVASSVSAYGGEWPVRIRRMEGVAFEGEKNTAGFPMIEVECVHPATIWVVMDEFAGGNSLPDPARFIGCVNAMGWRLEKPGRYSLESVHPYGFKCIHVMVEDGEVLIVDFKVRSYLNRDVKRASFACSDRSLNLVFEAAKQSLACNAVDLFIDCPGRERGAYFGDTVFTVRGADVLLGDTRMERALYENYALAPGFKDVPKGMIPMCYPADTMLDKPYWIPNFCMWSVVQLADYLRRSGDREMVESFRLTAEGMLAVFRKCRNEMELLENLPGWVFVEWSDASRFVDGISFATNMTYIRFLEAMAELYDDESCRNEAQRLRSVVRRLAWNGEWFCDNATRGKDGKLRLSGESTEVNQYLAFFSGVANREEDAELWNRILELGPMRKKGAYPRLWPSNLLFGYSLRFVLLSEAGESSRVLAETRHLYLPMAEKTGTLWESVSSDGYSCCHGFPSMAAWQLVRDGLGLKEILRTERMVRIAVAENSPLDWCEGTIPVSETEVVKIRWERKKGKVQISATLPKGWKSN